MHDLIIIGGGPAGVAAGVYAARKQLKTLLITKNFGGQSISSLGIENWIGEIKISGFELAQKLENHLVSSAGKFVYIKKGENVTKIIKNKDGFIVHTNSESFQTKTILITSGSERRKLIGVKNADKFEHKGLTYCATCDGPLFKDQVVAVIGGGNSAIESAMQLLAYTKKVYLIHRKDNFRADPITVNAIKNNSKLEIIFDSEVKEIIGDKMVNGVVLKNIKTDKESVIDVSGIFAEIGSEPGTDFIGDIVELTPEKTIKIDPWTGKTSTEGIWAAGDVTNIKYHQNNIAAGNAITAIEDIYTYIKSR